MHLPKVNRFIYLFSAWNAFNCTWPGVLNAWYKLFLWLRNCGEKSFNKSVLLWTHMPVNPLDTHTKMTFLTERSNKWSRILNFLIPWTKITSHTLIFVLPALTQVPSYFVLFFMSNTCFLSWNANGLLFLRRQVDIFLPAFVQVVLHLSSYRHPCQGQLSVHDMKIRLQR